MNKIAFFFILLIGCNTPSEKLDETEVAQVSRPSVADSVVVQITSNPVDSEISYIDEFGNYNHYRQGEIKLAIPSVLQDIHWQHQTSFSCSHTIHCNL